MILSCQVVLLKESIIKIIVVGTKSFIPAITVNVNSNQIGYYRTNFGYDSKPPSVYKEPPQGCGKLGV